MSNEGHVFSLIFEQGCEYLRKMHGWEDRKLKIKKLEETKCCVNLRYI